METWTKTSCTETILNAASANPSHWGDVSHGGQHRNATMLDLGSTTSLEVFHASVGRETCGIPETHGRLHAEFILEGAQRRICVVGPVAPSASSQAILRAAHQARQRTKDSQNARRRQNKKLPGWIKLTECEWMIEWLKEWLISEWVHSEWMDE